jgi:hypothetical protein
MSDEQKLYVIEHREVEFGTLTNDKWVRPADFHKVGISQDPEKRLGVLSSGTPHELGLVTTVEVDDAPQVERMIHAIERTHRRNRGEWLKLALNTLNSLIALDELKAENLKQVQRNWRRLDHRVSFYVAIHKARQGELKTFEELVA